jgi:uncharacterized protein YcbK (DUF882 family)
MNDRQLTTNFKLSEFACRDGTHVPDQFYDNVLTLAEQLQVIRDIILEPIYITSGFRTVSYNKQVGGAANSYHLKAMAADIYVKNTSMDGFHAMLKAYMDMDNIIAGGLKHYKKQNFIHYDIRGHYVTW